MVLSLLLIFASDGVLVLLAWTEWPFLGDHQEPPRDPAVPRQFGISFVNFSHDERKDKEGQDTPGGPCIIEPTNGHSCRSW